MQQKKKKMDEGPFYAPFLAASDRLQHLTQSHTKVKPGTWLALLEAQNQVLAECEEVPIDHVGIPEGFKRCTGVCEKVLKNTEEFFPWDSRLKSGLRARCKRCVNIKGGKKREREDEAGLDAVVAAAAAVAAVEEEGDALYKRELDVFLTWLVDFRWAPAPPSEKDDVLSVIWMWLDEERLGKCGIKTLAELKRKVGKVKQVSEVWPAIAGHWLKVNVWEVVGGAMTCTSFGQGQEDELNVMHFCHASEGERYDLLLPLESSRLNRDGYCIYRGEFPLSEAEIDMLKRQAMVEENVELLFNNALLGDDENDELRKQIPFSAFMDVAAELFERIHAKLGRMFNKHYAQDMNLLRSDPECKAQLPHADVTRLALEMSRDDCMPLGCVIATMPNTPFIVWEGAIRCFDPPADERLFYPKVLLLQPGDMLIFRGDLVHAGAAFDKFNVRIHAYLDVKGVVRNANDTQPMHECPWIVSLD